MVRYISHSVSTAGLLLPTNAHQHPALPSLPFLVIIDRNWDDHRPQHVFFRLIKYFLTIRPISTYILYLPSLFVIVSCSFRLYLYKPFSDCISFRTILSGELTKELERQLLQYLNKQFWGLRVFCSCVSIFFVLLFGL